MGLCGWLQLPACDDGAFGQGALGCGAAEDGGGAGALAAAVRLGAGAAGDSRRPQRQ